MKGFSILQIEDNELDKERLRRSLKKLSFKGDFHEALDGVEAMRILNGESYIKLKSPALIFLDLNMPKLSGFELLDKIKPGSLAKDIHIVILTTSEAAQDKERLTRSQLAGYLVKPATSEKIKKLVDSIFPEEKMAS